MFSSTKHIIAPERVRLGVAVIEMTECLKSWVRITPRRYQTPLRGVFRDSRLLAKAAKYLQKALEITDTDM
jgi:hypothetical protein